MLTGDTAATGHLELAVLPVAVLATLPFLPELFVGDVDGQLESERERVPELPVDDVGRASLLGQVGGVPT